MNGSGLLLLLLLLSYTELWPSFCSSRWSHSFTWSCSMRSVPANSFTSVDRFVPLTYRQFTATWIHLLITDPSGCTTVNHLTLIELFFLSFLNLSWWFHSIVNSIQVTWHSLGEWLHRFLNRFFTLPLIPIQFEFLYPNCWKKDLSLTHWWIIEHKFLTAKSFVSKLTPKESFLSLFDKIIE